MLVINPEECIDCGVCEPECPIEAIKSDEDLSAEEMHWADLNDKYSQIWPNVNESRGPLPEAEEYADKSSEEKKDLFSEKPGG